MIKESVIRIQQPGIKESGLSQRIGMIELLFGSRDLANLDKRRNRFPIMTMAIVSETHTDHGLSGSASNLDSTKWNPDPILSKSECKKSRHLANRVRV